MPSERRLPSAQRSRHRQLSMEPLWSLVVATGGNRWLIGPPRQRLKLAKTVAVGCDRLPEAFHGKRGSTVRVRQRALVRGKSPESGDFCCLTQHHRAPPHYRREGYPAAARLQSPLQIDLLPGTSEHLPEREGLEDAGLGGRVENGLTERRSERLLWRQTRGSDWARSWGQVACCRGVDAGSRGDRGMSRKGWAASTCPSPARLPFAGWQAAHRS
jgi:hypothetical protein